MLLELIFMVVGGLGIFLYGMENLSENMQKLAGNKLKSIVHMLTKNRIMAILLGTVVTVVVQSSSISTVMFIGLVNASIMNLTQAIGLIIGANIGTTVTGWVLVLKIGKYGLPMAGVGALIAMMSKNEKTKSKARLLMALGMIFMGLEFMGNGFRPLRTMPEFVEMFQRFEVTGIGSVILVASIGAILTALVQSSSATLGITIALAAEGLINYQTGAALVIGLNIGTTVTALLASIGANANAKRSAWSHTLINIIGLMWILPLYRVYTGAMAQLVDPVADITRYIAISHTVFNVINALAFIPFIHVLARFLERVIPDTAETEMITHLDIRMVNTPIVAIEQTKEEVMGMGNDIKTMFTSLNKYILGEGKEDTRDYLVSCEEKLDLVQKEITDINFALLKEDLKENDVRLTRENIEVADEYETVSDYITRISKSLHKLEENDILLNTTKKETLDNLHLKVEELFNYVNGAYETGNKDILIEAMNRSAAIKELYKKARREHMERVAENKMPAMLSTAYMDILNYYRRIKDHMVNVVETLSV